MPTDLEKTFTREMLRLYQRAKDEADYSATRFRQMVLDHGGVEAAHRLIRIPQASDGWTALWERKRLDLSVECLILQPRFEPLFSDDERAIARRWLRDYGFDPAQCEAQPSKAFHS